MQPDERPAGKTEPATEVASPNEPSLTELRLRLPEDPGVYRYYDLEGRVLYVGKAKNLRKRVNSYFNKNTSHDFKTRVLVGQIARLEYVITNSEQEALLLENSLIKQLQPRYNILLKDGKSYPYICVKKEPFPRVFSTRHKQEDGSTYYGPYTSVGTMRAILDFLQENFKLRTCTLNLSERNIRAGKFRPCLEFHMGRCLAPCVGKQPLDEYEENIRQIRQILRGNFRAVLLYLKQQMQEAATQLQFERAHYLKSRMEQIQRLKRKSTVVSERVTQVEVVALLSEGSLAVVNHFRIFNGAIISARSLEVRARAQETEGELFEAALALLLAENEDFHPLVLTNLEVRSESATALTATEAVPEAYQRGPEAEVGEAPDHELNPEPLEPEGESEGVREPETGEVSPWKAREQTLELADRKLTLRIPARGDERKLVDLSLKNCKTLLEEKLNTSKANKRQAQLVDLLSQMQRELRLTKYPRHIECFDNSHIQGTAPVSSAVVFRDAKPAKRDYRTYNVRNPQGIDDFAWMEDVVYRRYAKFLDEGLELPDLIVIDGGKGQLSSAISALKRLGIETQVAVIGIAKRLEEIYYMDDPVPLYIDKKSPTLRLLQRIRNEAHDTAINFHRRKRDKQTLRTRLTEVPGIGPRTAKTLLQHFKSTERVSRATEEQLAAIIGPMKARLLVQFREQEAAETAAENPD